MNVQNPPKVQESKPEVSISWHALCTEDVLARLNTQTLGLSTQEVEARLQHYGRNELKEKKKGRKRKKHQAKHGTTPSRAVLFGDTKKQ